jgi:hypothetical protein
MALRRSGVRLPSAPPKAVHFDKQGGTAENPFVPGRRWGFFLFFASSAKHVFYPNPENEEEPPCP